MIILLDTSSPVCKLTIVSNGDRTEYEWQADRTLAKDLLKWLEGQLKTISASLQDITGIGVFVGPGSFTGLRIGLTVMNTLADGLNVPIVGVQAEQWKDEAVARLEKGENNKIALPYYGADANITTPRK